MKRLFFNLWYWLPGKLPWDTGISPPELREVVEGAGRLAPGRALDLGCGTGTNVVYLAQHGWRAVGVDFVGKAIRTARRKARAAGVEAQCEFYVASVTDLSFLQPPFDLALDMGCFHSLDSSERARYSRALARLLRPGAIYLLYAFKPGGGWGNGSVTENDIREAFGPAFRIVRVVEGSGRPSAWYTLERTSNP